MPDELARLVGLLVTRMLGFPDATVGGRVLDALAGCLPPDYPWPGNVRELEQTVRRVLLTGRYDEPSRRQPERAATPLLQAIDDGRLGASALLARYCQLLYKRLGTYASGGGGREVHAPGPQSRQRSTGGGPMRNARCSPRSAVRRPSSMTGW